MSSEHRTPKRLWFKPMPNPGSPLEGGALLSILPQGEGAEVLTVGLDLARLLQLQVALSNLLKIVVTHSVTAPPEPENPITETEIERFVRELDTPTEEGTTNE